LSLLHLLGVTAAAANAAADAGTASGSFAVIDAADGSAVGTKSRPVCNALWATHTVPAGWNVQGVCGTTSLGKREL
jgi:hypothetical protein